jgi:hypothetical protein
MKILVLLLINLVWIYSAPQNCLNYQNVSSNIVLNGNFSSTNCGSTICTYYRNSFSTNNLLNWFPLPQLRVCRAYYYSNYRLPDKRAI